MPGDKVRFVEASKRFLFTQLFVSPQVLGRNLSSRGNNESSNLHSGLHEPVAQWKVPTIAIFRLWVQVMSVIKLKKEKKKT